MRDDLFVRRDSCFFEPLTQRDLGLEARITLDLDRKRPIQVDGAGDMTAAEFARRPSV